MKRAFTLIELLIGSLCAAIIALTTTFAFANSLNMNSKLEFARNQRTRAYQFEKSVTTLLERAYLTTTATDRTTYLLGSSRAPSVIPSDLGQTGANGNTGSSSNGSADTLTFTVLGRRLPAVLVNSTDDFSTLNQRFGPQGGVSEIQLSTTSVSGPSGKTGVFLRSQTPSDGDPSQGGFQELLSDAVSTLSFEFFDGSTWQTSWDTTTDRRLPTAIRITYQFDGEQNSHIFVVRLPLSTITPGQTSTTGGTN